MFEVTNDWSNQCVIRRFYFSIYFDVVGKMKAIWIFDHTTQVVYDNLYNKWSPKWSLWHIGLRFIRCVKCATLGNKVSSTLTSSNEMQQYAGIYLLQNYGTCFGCLSYPSSGVHHLATGRQHRGCIIPQAVTHSLVLLKMGKIIARNLLSWLKLLISRYCCI